MKFGMKLAVLGAVKPDEVVGDCSPWGCDMFSFSLSPIHVLEGQSNTGLDRQ